MPTRLVVCEVKTRSGTRFGEPAEAVTRARPRRIRRLTQAPGSPRTTCAWCEVRFDVVAVLMRAGRRRSRVHHYEAAF